MKIPSIIHSVWLGPNPQSTEILKCIVSQIHHHPTWKFWSWTDDNSPKLTCPLSSHAATSNVIRLWALYEFGGLYLDADVEVLKPFDPLLEHQAFIARQPDGVFCNAVMGAVPRSPWIKWMLDKAIAEQQFNDAAFCCHIVEDSPLEGVTILPASAFYSWNWDEDPKPAAPDAYCLHHWQKSWVKA